MVKLTAAEKKGFKILAIVMVVFLVIMKIVLHFTPLMTIQDNPHLGPLPSDGRER